MLRVAAAAQLAALAVLVMVPAQALPCSAGLRHAAPRGELAPPLRGAANATAPEDEHPGHSTAALRPRGDEVTRAGPSHVGPRRGTWGASLSSVLGAFVSMAHGARSGRRLEASAAQVSAGSYHSVVLLTDGTVRAFGAATSGRLGYGSEISVGDVESRLPSLQGPVPVGGAVVAVAAGDSHTLVVLVDGTVKAFGEGDYGKLGYGSTDNVGDKLATVPSAQGPVPLNGTAKAVSAGEDHSLVLMDDGTVFAFGRSDSGRLGYGNYVFVGSTPETIPSAQGPVPLNGTATAVSAGGSHSMVLMDDGTVLAFGSGASGRLGYGSDASVGATPETVPSAQGPVPLNGTVVAVAAGGTHSLVVLADGTVRAFGNGGYGKLGYGSTETLGLTPETLPSVLGPVPLNGTAVAVAAGQGHSLVLMDDGTVQAFGAGIYGQLGSGSTANVGDTPETLPSAQDPVSLGGTAVAVAAGRTHSLVMLADGTVRAFGDGGYGRLGIALSIGLSISLTVALVIALSIGLRVALGIALGIPVSVALCIAFYVAIGIPISVALCIAIDVAIGFAIGFAIGIVLADVIDLGFTFSLADPHFHFHPHLHRLSYPHPHLHRLSYPHLHRLSYPHPHLHRLSYPHLHLHHYIHTDTLPLPHVIRHGQRVTFAHRLPVAHGVSV
ncbi:hypothetical protein FNF27_06763 [Cafeteria roenbergensis]|uniref:Uncharacterized protein n=1 Tax=Cafeteria roenbergensis TaxID=33653 RepID=A0A5A8E1R4_CAFRO|nr:hypothetical protein FNF27_06763 [Cafeteria roenbergensis]